MYLYVLVWSRFKCKEKEHELLQTLPKNTNHLKGKKSLFPYKK